MAEWTEITRGEPFALHAGVVHANRGPERLAGQLDAVIAGYLAADRERRVGRVVIEHIGPPSQLTQKAYRLAAEYLSCPLPLELPKAPVARPHYFEVLRQARDRLAR
jgi:hypothetical protein